MQTSLSRFSAPALAAIGLAFSVARCAYDREPTGVEDVNGVRSASRGGLVYAEERRAVELAQVIPDLAGFFFDTSGNVVVLLKDVGERPSTKSLLRPRFGRELARGRVRNPTADLIVRTAKYAFLELKGWRDRLMGADILAIPDVVWLDLDEARNRVVIGLEIGGGRAAAGDVARGLGLPAEAVEFEVTGPYVSQQTLRDEFRPIQGGIQIQRVAGTSRATCTLGFTAVWQDQDAFLTSGHCSPDVMGTDNVAQFQPTAPLTASDSATMTPIGRETFRSSAQCGNGRCSYSDAAVYALVADTVPPIPGEAWTLGRVAQPASGCFPGPCNPPVLDLAPSPYWVIDTTHDSFVVNDLVSKIGSATGWSQGYVQNTCVNVSPSQGVTYYCQMLANYGQGEGDSGAPILLDINGGTDSTVTLGGIHSGKTGKKAVFSPWSGIVQDYGSLSVVPAQQDTTRPPVPPLPNLPSDSTFTVESPRYPRSQLLYYRNIVGVTFDDSTRGTTIRALFTRYNATVIGGVPDPVEPEYLLQVPDPGPTLEALDSLLNRLGQEPGVKRAASVYYRTPGSIYWRHPDDGAGARRRDWSSPIPTDTTRALRAIRAPLAWGCETGAYEQNRVAVAVVDYMFDANQPDLEGVLVGPPDPPAPEPPALILQDVAARSHGTAVAGVLTAVGDNGVGLAGVMWRSNLTMYSYSRGNWVYPDLGRLLRDRINRAIAQGVRVLVFSHAIGDVGNDAHVAILRAPLEAYVRSGGLLVMATGQTTGQPGLTLTVGELAQTTNTRLHALHRAVAQLYDAGDSNSILFAGATDDAGRFWSTSNYWRGATILAPGTNIVTLANTADFPTGTWTVNGTSWSAPYVAGVAGLLWAADPTLTAAQVKDLILRGAQVPRWNPQTNQMQPAQPVSGAPSGETVYQLDAYGALKLAAERQGAPLCGNRVWVNSNAVIAERDPAAHTTQQLVNLGEPAAWVNARHGGRRIEVFTNTTARAFELRQGAWVETPDTATTPAGGTFLSMQALSHDLDTLATARYWTSGDSALFEHTIHTFNPSTQRVLDTLVVRLSRFTGSECVRRDSSEVCNLEMPTVGTEERVVSELAYPPAGNRLLVTVTYLVTRFLELGGWQPCPLPPPGQGPPPDPTTCRTAKYQEVSERTDLWAIDVTTGADTLLWPTPGRAYWLGMSEDGGQVVRGEGVLTTVWTWQPKLNGDGFEQVFSNPGTVTGCGVRYRNPATGGEVAPAIATADACTMRGPGTIAPTPPTVTSR